MPAFAEQSDKKSSTTGGGTRRRAAKASRDKAVEAQRKNKLENASLQLYHAMLDRKKVHTTVMLNREKEELRTTMKRMRKTTGYCKEGLPPEGPSDTAHEKSPYFQTSGHVSEKRLQRWKNEEKALQRLLLSEEELRPPWEKGSLEVAEETLGHLLNLLGYDEDEAKVMMEKLRNDKDNTSGNWGANGHGVELEKEADGSIREEEEEEVRRLAEEKKLAFRKRSGTLRSASASSFSGFSVQSEPVVAPRIDVFECLKESETVVEPVCEMPKAPVCNDRTSYTNSNSNRLLASVSADDIFRSSTAADSEPPKFSFKNWEKQMTERYKNSLVNPAKSQYTTSDGDNSGTEIKKTIANNVARSMKKKRPSSAPAHAPQGSSFLATRRRHLKATGSGQHQRTGATAALSGGRSISDLRPGGEGSNEGQVSAGVHLRPPACPRVPGHRSPTNRQRPVTAATPLSPRALEAGKDAAGRSKTAYKNASPSQAAAQAAQSSRPCSTSASSSSSAATPTISIDQADGKSPPPKPALKFPRQSATTHTVVANGTKGSSPTQLRSNNNGRPRSASPSVLTAKSPSALKSTNKEATHIATNSTPTERTESNDLTKPAQAPQKRAQFAPDVDSPRIRKGSLTTKPEVSARPKPPESPPESAMRRSPSTGDLHAGLISNLAKSGINMAALRRRRTSSVDVPASFGNAGYKRSLSLPTSSPLHLAGGSTDTTSPRAGQHVRARRMTLAALPVLDSGDEEDEEGDDYDDEADVSGEVDLRAKWRRNLLRDAPPGFNSGGREKIKLAISKNQLRRDMEQMVVDHESDVRDKIRKEHVRRMRKRMDIMLTLQKLAKDPEEEAAAEEAKMTGGTSTYVFPGGPQKSKSDAQKAPKFAASVNTIMQLMRLKKKAAKARDNLMSQKACANLIIDHNAAPAASAAAVK